ncbi:MAG: S41 family peptidase, partial [Prolixibacteraceae bacterium]|nr:S41 family peptidase [Prolixibacteraceae bacterium]
MKIVKRGILSIILTLFIFTGFGQGVQTQSVKYNRLLRLIDSYYVDSTNLEKLTEIAITNILSELDPHSVYISKDEVDKANEPLKGSFDGIGVSFNIMHDTLMVIQTIPGGPSEKVGLEAGDRIIFIDDELVAGIKLTNKMVFDRLRGEKGSMVNVKIKRKREKDLLDFDIIRDKIPIFSLGASYMLNETTGYIKLDRFSATTTQEFVQAIGELKATNALENLVLDLRGNGGGYLKAAHEISDQLLSTKRTIVYTKGLKNPRKDYTSTYIGEFEKGNLVVIIDGGSASASEIVSGAVQDWDRGVIIGRRSFGKGLVQQPLPLTDGSMIRLTTAKYYTPSGRCIQKDYEHGVNEYRNDINERAVNGELFNKDSIHVIDSLAYKTLINGRTVYGGGGIVPDIFIAIDTSTNYLYYNKLVRKSVVNQFIREYIDENRTTLKKKYPTFEEFKTDFDISNKMLESLWEAGDKKEIERDPEAIEFISDFAKLQLKAFIARDLWKSSEYYEIINSNNKEIIKALEILNDQTKYNA